MKILSKPSVILMLLAASAIVLCCAACDTSRPYSGPQIGTVGVTGSYSDKQGDTYGGGVQVGLNYPSPTPTPVPSKYAK